MDERQDPGAVQEDEYRFPYHHVPVFRNGFRQHFVWTWGIQYACTLEMILSELRDRPFDDFVDIGCGDGRLVSEISSMRPGARVEGYDISERAIALASAMLPGGTFHCEDITGIDPPAKPYDAGSLIEVIEHLPPAAAPGFMKAVSALVRPGGFLLLSTPSVSLPPPPKHFRHFDTRSLTELVEPFFEIEKTIFLEPEPDLESKVLSKLLCNRLFVLNWKRASDAIYRRFRERHFVARNEKSCRRLFMVLRRRGSPGSGR